MAAPYVDLVDTFYGHADIPIGIVHDGISAERFNQKPFNTEPQPYSPNGINYTQFVSQLSNRQGALVYPHALMDSDHADEAVHLLRRVLSQQLDHSVVMIQVGYSTNFARLLDSHPYALSPLDGISLIRRKVRLLSTMAGNYGSTEFEGQKYPSGTPEFNLMMDIPAAQKVFSQWTTPIVASGFEIGLKMLFPQRVVDRDFNYTAHHPIAETYQYVAPYYRKASKTPNLPHDHATFDLTAVLYAARPDEGYFDVSQAGTITVLPDGGSRFHASEGGQHRYLMLSEAQRARTLEAMVMLTSQPPTNSKH